MWRLGIMVTFAAFKTNPRLPTRNRIPRTLKSTVNLKSRSMKILGFSRTTRRKEKARRRLMAFNDGSSWMREGATAHRIYGGYDEYVAHQMAKLGKIQARLKKTESQDFAEFTRRFQSCGPLQEARSVLCLGARLGTEVRALRDLGHFAVGIDLNPGYDNAYVLPGDFHKLAFADGSVDAVYTNALDHAFDLGAAIGEVRRVLRPSGLFLVDLVPGFEEGFVPGAFEAFHWRDADTLIATIGDLGGFALVDTQDLGRFRNDCWHRAVWRKSV
jgi:SAM-dependent methyltransferase